MRVFEAISNALLQSPSVFKNRLAVIDHMLFVIGNGDKKNKTIAEAVVDLLNRRLLYDD